MSCDEIVKRDQHVVMPTYGQRQLVLVRGEGVRVWDLDGKCYLDFLSGLGVNSLGHCHPKVVEAIRKQAGILIHVSNLYYNTPQIELAERLSLLFGDGLCFFCNSGTEAVEGAIKLAMKIREGRSGFVSMLNSFHGRTAGALTATGQEKYRQGFGLLSNFSYVPLNDLDAVRDVVNDQTAGVIVEPIQGEGGVYPATQDFLRGLRTLADQTGVVLIFDEVQCGMGRTCKLFCFEHYGVKPDVVCLAKALAGGFPMGAFIATRDKGACLTRGAHASTFGGTPLACAASLACLDVLCAEGFLDRAARVGERIVSRITGFGKAHGGIREIRGKGLMLGVELEKPVAQKVAIECRERGLLLNAIGDHTVRLLPPLVLSEEAADEGCDIMESALLDALQ